MLFSDEKIERDLNLLMNNLQPLSMERDESLDIFQNLAVSTEDLIDTVQEVKPSEKEKEGYEVQNEFLEPVASPLPARSGSKHRKSITPLKIRDNINYFFGGKQDEVEAEEQSVPMPTSASNESLNLDYIEVPDSDFPIGRYAIVDPNQRVAFMWQLEKIKGQNEYFFYYKWVLWIQNKGGGASGNSAGEALSAEKIIETNLDLKVATKFYKKKLKEEDGTLIFMKMGMLPNKKSPKLINSSTITFQVPDQVSYEMLKETVQIVLNDELTTPYTLDSEY